MRYHSFEAVTGRLLSADFVSEGGARPRYRHGVDHRYTYRLEWSSSQGAYMARCLEIDGLVAVATTARQALERVQEEVDRWLRQNDEFGDPAPKPLSERDFSGRFMVRTSHALHARMAMEAVEQGVSLNQWIVQKLVDRKPSLDW